MYGTAPLGCVTGALLLSIVLDLIDFRRKRFRTFQRVMYKSTAAIFLFGCIYIFVLGQVGAASSNLPTKVDVATLLMFALYTILAIIECRVCKYPDNTNTEKRKKAKLTTGALHKILSP